MNMYQNDLNYRISTEQNQTNTMSIAKYQNITTSIAKS